HLVSRASYSVRGIAVTEKSYTALTRVGLLLKPALLLEVGLRGRMHRGGVTLVRHILRVEVRECRMQALEGVEVLEHGVDEGTNDLIRHVRRGNNRRAHAERVHVVRIAVVHPAGDHRLEVVRTLSDELVDHLAFDGDDARVAGR